MWLEVPPRVPFVIVLYVLCNTRARLAIPAIRRPVHGTHPPEGVRGGEAPTLRLGICGASP